MKADTLDSPTEQPMTTFSMSSELDEVAEPEVTKHQKIEMESINNDF